MSRWVPIYATTPSGKTLFVCIMCGRKSPTPDKTCPEIPEAAGWKLATTCAVLEEIEEAAFDAGERHVRLGERIMVGVMKDGTALAQWQSESGDCKRVHVQIKDDPTVRKGPKGHRFERTPDGHIDNCSLANGESEESCQVCNGHCPDRRRYK